MEETQNTQSKAGPLNMQSQSTEEIYARVRQVVKQLVEYKELRTNYACALKIVRTKFEILDAEFQERYQRNPIDHITTRVKSNQSIAGKMVRFGVPFSPENIEERIRDIAGIRIICPYADDIYMLAEALLAQSDITLLERKDYIENPKPSGYRSLHLIVSVPVFFAEQPKYVPVEVQIRTIAMDFWASLEHQMKYKKHYDTSGHISARLKSCADQIAALDTEMQDIRIEIDSAKAEPTEDEILLQRMGQWLDSASME